MAALGQWGKVEMPWLALDFLGGATISVLAEEHGMRAKDVRKRIKDAWIQTAFGEPNTPRGFYETERFG